MILDEKASLHPFHERRAIQKTYFVYHNYARAKEGSKRKTIPKRSQKNGSIQKREYKDESFNFLLIEKKAFKLNMNTKSG